MVEIGAAVPLWGGAPPGSEGWDREERTWSFPAPVEMSFLRNVVHPTLTPVLPHPSLATGAGVVVCPGGGYFMLAIDHEGWEVADWLAARGVAAFVLKYRVLETPADDEALMATMVDAGGAGLEGILERMEPFAPIPLADGLAALGLVRDRAEEWGVPPDRLGAVGFSAGGRLVLDLATQDEPASRPAFAGAIYAAASPRPVPADAPPLFIAVAVDDPLVDGSVRAQAAWQQAGRPVEAHYYSRGGHGFGMRKTGLPADRWIEQFHEWMSAEGFLG